MKIAARRLTVILIAAAAVFGISIYAAYFLARSADENRARVLHTYRAIQAAGALLSLAQDAETGQRGYLLTRMDSYLQPYRDAVAAIPGQLAEVEALVADSQDQRARVARLRTLIREKLDILEQVIATVRTGELTNLGALLHRGKAVMDGIRATIDEILNEERRLLAQREERVQSSETETLIVSLIGALVALIVASVSLARNYRRLRQGEIALTRKTVELQGTLDNCRDGIAVFGEDRLLTASNDRFFRLFDLPREFRRDRRAIDELRTGDGRPLEALLRPPPGAAVQIGEGGGTLFQIDHNGRHLEIYQNDMPDGGIIVSCADVTRRVRAEALMRQTQKMEAVGHLTGGIAHDFNNLLQVIRSNLDLLSSDVAGKSRAEARLRDALTATERGARLTQQLLAFARRQPLKPVSINLGRLVGNMTDLLRRTLGETIEIESIIAGGLWNTLVDPNQVENAIINLAVNARDAMPDGGKLTIELNNAALDEAYAASQSEVTPGQYVMLAVTDTGTGMTPEVMARAFEPFYTTKAEGQGTGLGLSMVYGFVKQSGGHVRIYSEPGHGTSVKLYLPRTRRPEERAFAHSPQGPAVGGTETILLVEDEPAVRRATREMLLDLGYRVLEAEDGETALARLAGGETVDMLLTDVVIPGPVGSRELARRVKERYPDIAILFASGYTENAIIHHGRLDEDVQLISKPFGRSELAHKIRAILDGRPRGQASATAPVRDARNSQKSRTLTVLVVEDEPLIRLATVEQIEELGHVAVGAADGREALRALDGHDAIDVLLTDLGLPDMNGSELAAAARRQRPDIGIVIATGHHVSGNGGDAGIARAVHLVKPYRAEELRRAIEQSRSA
jgi:signal transduction histidine kinase/DNA-binding response OmpR family regulator